jgi:hypothetical protein
VAWGELQVQKLRSSGEGAWLSEEASAEKEAAVRARAMDTMRKQLRHANGLLRSHAAEALESSATGYEQNCGYLAGYGNTQAERNLPGLQPESSAAWGGPSTSAPMQEARAHARKGLELMVELSAALMSRVVEIRANPQLKAPLK